MKCFAAGGTPDPQARTGGANLSVGVTGLVEEALRPIFDRTSDQVADMINVDSGERILRRQYVADAIAFSGCGYRIIV
jgi:hypothetical protein